MKIRILASVIGVTFLGGAVSDISGQVQPEFAYTAAIHRQLMRQHPLAGQVLLMASGEFKYAVRSQEYQGISNAKVGTDYAYKATISTTESKVTVQFAFEQINTGPRPNPVRVEIDSSGFIVVSPL